MVEADSLKQNAQERTVNRRLDPADLANRIRKLAADTHRTLRSQHADPHELIEFALRDPNIMTNFGTSFDLEMGVARKDRTHGQTLRACVKSND